MAVQSGMSLGGASSLASVVDDGATNHLHAVVGSAGGKLLGGGGDWSQHCMEMAED